MVRSGRIVLIVCLVVAIPAGAAPRVQTQSDSRQDSRPRLPEFQRVAEDASLERKLVTAMEDALATAYPAHAPALRVRLIRSSIEDAAGAIRVRLLRNELPRAHTRVDVISTGDSGDVTKGWAILYVERYDTLAVPLRAIARGETIDQRDVTFARVETTRFHGTPLLAAHYRTMMATSGAVADRALVAGRPLRTNDLRAPWAVNTGEVVKMHYQRPGITLTLNAKAREPGSIDDAIRVYCSDTGTTYRARLVGPGEAVWLETL